MRKFLSERTKRYSKNLVRYFLELLIVTFGVFLGIYIGERKNKQKTENNTEIALTQIISELNSNSERLKLAISYHEQIGVEIDSVLKSFSPDDYSTLYFNNKKFNHNNLPAWRGIGTVRLSKSIYESAKIGGVFLELNISTINLISSIYEYQEVYDEFNKSTVEKMLAMDSKTVTGDVIQLLTRLTKYDIMNIEKGLFNKIEMNIKVLEESIDNKTYMK